MTARLLIAVDDLELAAGFGRITAALGDLTPFMEIVGAALEGGVMDRFERGEAPDGSKWPPSRAARAEGRPTLVKSGRLRDSIATEITPASVAIGTNVIYAGVHQGGRTIQAVRAKALRFQLPDGRFVSAKSVTIPARPFLGFSAEDAAEIGGLAEDYFGGAWAG